MDNEKIKDNIICHADVYKLIVLINLEFLNSELIKQNKSQKERLIYLRKSARNQLELAINSPEINRLLNKSENSKKITIEKIKTMLSIERLKKMDIYKKIIDEINKSMSEIIEKNIQTGRMKKIGIFDEDGFTVLPADDEDRDDDWN